MKQNLGYLHPAPSTVLLLSLDTNKASSSQVSVSPMPVCQPASHRHTNICSRSKGMAGCKGYSTQDGYPQAITALYWPHHYGCIPRSMCLRWNHWSLVLSPPAKTNLCKILLCYAPDFLTSTSLTFLSLCFSDSDYHPTNNDPFFEPHSSSLSLLTASSTWTPCSSCFMYTASSAILVCCK